MQNLKQKEEIIQRAKMYAKCIGKYEHTCIACVLMSNSLSEKILKPDLDRLKAVTDILLQCDDMQQRNQIAGYEFFGYQEEKAEELCQQIGYRM